MVSSVVHTAGEEEYLAAELGGTHDKHTAEPLFLLYNRLQCAARVTLGCTTEGTSNSLGCTTEGTSNSKININRFEPRTISVYLAGLHAALGTKSSRASCRARPTSS